MFLLMFRPISPTPAISQPSLITPPQNISSAIKSPLVRACLQAFLTDGIFPKNPYPPELYFSHQISSCYDSIKGALVSSRHLWALRSFSRYFEGLQEALCNFWESLSSQRPSSLELRWLRSLRSVEITIVAIMIATIWHAIGDFR